MINWRNKILSNIGLHVDAQSEVKISRNLLDNTFFIVWTHSNIVSRASWWPFIQEAWLVWTMSTLESCWKLTIILKFKILKSARRKLRNEELKWFTGEDTFFPFFSTQKDKSHLHIAPWTFQGMKDKICLLVKEIKNSLQH